MAIDFPAWVQAVGSVAAIFVATRIARTEQRLRRREALAAAGVTAALVETTLVNIRSAVTMTRRAHREIATRHDGLLIFVAAANQVVAVPVPSEDQLIRLTASHMTGAEDLADLCSKLDRVRALLPTIDWSADARGDHGPGLSSTDGVLGELAAIESMTIAAQRTLNEFRSALSFSREAAEDRKQNGFPIRDWASLKKAFRRIWP
jgi:hypothetical protein